MNFDIDRSISINADIDLSISDSITWRSVSCNSERHMKSIQPIKCMLFILICNKYYYMKKSNNEILPSSLQCLVSQLPPPEA